MHSFVENKKSNSNKIRCRCNRENAQKIQCKSKIIEMAFADILQYLNLDFI